MCINSENFGSTPYSIWKVYYNLFNNVFGVKSDVQIRFSTEVEWRYIKIIFDKRPIIGQSIRFIHMLLTLDTGLATNSILHKWPPCFLIRRVLVMCVWCLTSATCHNIKVWLARSKDEITTIHICFVIRVCQFFVSNDQKDCLIWRCLHKICNWSINTTFILISHLSNLPGLCYRLFRMYSICFQYVMVHLIPVSLQYMSLSTWIYRLTNLTDIIRHCL